MTSPTDQVVLGNATRFLRGNIHTHSNRSDGALSPQDVAAWYENEGYDFLAITDHYLPEYGNRITNPNTIATSSLILLCGAELHPLATRNGDPWHLIALGIPLDFPAEQFPQAPKALVRAAREAGAWVSIAHPSAQGISEADYDAISPVDAIEIYNEGTVWWDDRPHGWYLGDAIAARGTPIGAVAVDDAHFAGKPDHGKAWVMVDTNDTTPSGILSALKQNRYFSTQGPMIHNLSIENATLRVQCSPSQLVIAAGRGATVLSTYGDQITSAEFPLAPFLGGYIRVSLLNDRGLRAWSNPIHL